MIYSAFMILLISSTARWALPYWFALLFGTSSYQEQNIVRPYSTDLVVREQHLEKMLLKQRRQSEKEVSS
jgi:hypothetical protein